MEAHQAPPSLKFSRQEQWGRLPFPSPCLKQINNRNNAESLRYFVHTHVHIYVNIGTFCKEIQPVHSKGDQSWVFIGRSDAKAETPVLWPPHAKSWLIGKDSDAGRDWGQEEKGTTEDEMAGWHNQLDGHEFEWAPGVGDGQGGLACCHSWGRKESNMTERLNWTELRHILKVKSSHFISSFKCHAKLRMIFILVV